MYIKLYNAVISRQVNLNFVSIRKLVVWFLLSIIKNANFKVQAHRGIKHIIHNFYDHNINLRRDKTMPLLLIYICDSHYNISQDLILLNLLR